MSRASKAKAATRRDEIIAACRSLYDTMSFQEITVKEISTKISCNRSSVYTYFHTKEEIFLAILQEEYRLWNEDLRRIPAENEELRDFELAECIAHTLEKRGRMLKLLSMNLYDIEKNSGIQALAEFKKVYGETISILDQCLEKLAPIIPEDVCRQKFISAFMPFLFGIYPYTSVTEKQQEAMKIAGIPYNETSIYDLVHNGVRMMLSFLPFRA